MNKKKLIKYYVSASSISDTNIAALNSIMLGFSTADLSTLVFSSTTSITALGALSGWSTAQVEISLKLFNF